MLTSYLLETFDSYSEFPRGKMRVLPLLWTPMENIIVEK